MRLFAGFLAIGLAVVLVGCGDEGQRPSDSTKGALEKAKAKAEKAVEKSKEEGEKAIEKTKEESEKAVSKVKEEGEKAVNKVKEESDKAVGKVKEDADKLKTPPPDQVPPDAPKKTDDK